MNLTIVSENLMDVPWIYSWNKRIRQTAREILKLNPDIISFQEAVFKKTRRTLENELKGYTMYKGDASEILIFSKIPIKGYKYEKYKKNGYWYPFSWSDAIAGKGFQHIKFDFGKEKINLLNTHLIAPYTKFKSKAEFEVILSQLDQLISYCKKLKGKLIICGDFNFGTKMMENTHARKDLYKRIKDKLNILNPLEKEKINYFNFRAPFDNKFFQKFLPPLERYVHVFLKGFEKKKVYQKNVLTEKIDAGNKKVYPSNHPGILTKINF
ncbi:MAG: endonuclease/exonuclease/phosphatase family protein [archaeon]|nr:endonuclease/exonuclease/phosphatase family protein [archaeon]